MYRFRLPLIALLFVLISALAWVKITNAQSFMSQTSSGQTVNGSLYSVSQNVNIEGTINGDVYCAGQNVTIDATVHGDVLCAGQTVTVNGHIEGSLRIAAQTLNDDAKVDRSIGVVAQNATISKSASVGGDVSFAGQELRVNGLVGRDVVVAAKTFDLNGRIQRNVKFQGSTLDLWSNARIFGNLNYTSQQTANIARSARVDGTVGHVRPAVRKVSVRATFAGWAASFIYFFAAMLLFGIVLVLLIPQTARAVSEEPAKHLGRTLLNGLGLAILEPIVLVGLLASIVGIPLAAVCLVLFVLIGVCSLPAAAFYVGTLIMSRTANALLIMAVGMFVLTLLLMVPILGVFVAIATFFIGAGAIVMSLRKYVPTPVYKVK